jgi:hypothetical protein
LVISRTYGKSLKTDRINGVADIEIHRDELKNIVESVSYMTDKVKKELLENLPSSEESRKRLDDYAALKEDLRKILEDLH